MNAFKAGLAILVAIPLLLVLGVFVLAFVSNLGFLGWIISFIGIGVGVLLGLGAMSEESENEGK